MRIHCAKAQETHRGKTVWKGIRSLDELQTVAAAEEISVDAAVLNDIFTEKE